MYLGKNISTFLLMQLRAMEGIQPFGTTMPLVMMQRPTSPRAQELPRLVGTCDICANYYYIP